MPKVFATKKLCHFYENNKKSNGKRNVHEKKMDEIRFFCL